VRRRRRRLSHEARIVLHAVVAALVPVLVALGLLWLEPHSSKLRWTLTLACATAWLAVGFGMRDEIARPVQTLSNLLAALREGDFSLRARHERGDDAVAIAFEEANELAAVLRRERYGAQEASALLQKTMAAIDVALFVFDDDARLTLCNPAAERLVGIAAAQLHGRRAADVGLQPLLEGGAWGESPLAVTFGGVTRHLEVRRGPMRQDGRAATLVLASDISRALRAEERQAFERLVRVLGHEINNSLAPISAIAESLRQRAAGATADGEFGADLARGLEVIERRAESLARFMSSYARLLRLPPPRLAAVDVGAWIRRVAPLETRRPIAVAGGPDVTVQADADQLDQLLINLVRNAVEAAAETDGAVTIDWLAGDGVVTVRVRDEGPGLSSTGNLFVPFFTTKPSGSGIGLVLSRQIAESHGGSLTLANRSDGRGCEARLTLPIDERV
jgi:two-component system, NtrC family, nitrogen regulation sensor histidine kinase NtrY